MMSFKTALAAFFCMCILATSSARGADFTNLFACWLPVLFGGQFSINAPHPSITIKALEDPLHSQARHFLSQQVVIVESAHQNFLAGAKLRDLLSRSQHVMQLLLKEFPAGDESFRAKFGVERDRAETFPFFGSSSLPRLPREQMELLNHATREAMAERLLAEMGDGPRTQSQTEFLERVYSVRSSHYHYVDQLSVTALYTFLGGPETGDDTYYISFPERAVIDPVLKDAEVRLEAVRNSVSAKARKEQFLIALYGYVVARPYRAGNQAIGWPVFAGIYQALTGEPLPGIYGRDDLSRMATLSQARFVSELAKEIERHR